MTLSNALSGLLALVGVTLGVALYVSRDSVHNLERDNKTLARDVQTQTQGRERAEWLLNASDQTMQVFSAIRVANQASRLASEKQLNESVKNINQSVADDACAKRAVPVAAVNELLRVEDAARAASRGSVTAH